MYNKGIQRFTVPEDEVCWCCLYSFHSLKIVKNKIFHTCNEGKYFSQKFFDFCSFTLGEVTDIAELDQYFVIIEL